MLIAAGDGARMLRVNEVGAGSGLAGGGGVFAGGGVASAGGEV